MYNIGCDQADADELVECLRALPPEDINRAFDDYVVRVHYCIPRINFKLSSSSQSSFATLHKADERYEARLGFAGSIPCAQTHGQDKFYSAENGDKPESLLIEGNYRLMQIGRR